MNIQIYAEVSENKTHLDSKIIAQSHLCWREPQEVSGPASYSK